MYTSRLVIEKRNCEDQLRPIRSPMPVTLAILPAPSTEARQQLQGRSSPLRLGPVNHNEHRRQFTESPKTLRAFVREAAYVQVDWICKHWPTFGYKSG